MTQQEAVLRSLWGIRYLVVMVLRANSAPEDIQLRAKDAPTLSDLEKAVNEAAVANLISREDLTEIRRLLVRATPE